MRQTLVAVAWHGIQAMLPGGRRWLLCHCTASPYLLIAGAYQGMIQELIRHAASNMGK